MLRETSPTVIGWMLYECWVDLLIFFVKNHEYNTLLKLLSFTDCDVNCHKKCEKLAANLCGVNQKLIVEAIATVRRENQGVIFSHALSYSLSYFLLLFESLKFNYLLLTNHLPLTLVDQQAEWDKKNDNPERFLRHIFVFLKWYRNTEIKFWFVKAFFKFIFHVMCVTMGSCCTLWLYDWTCYRVCVDCG